MRKSLHRHCERMRSNPGNRLPRRLRLFAMTLTGFAAQNTFASHTGFYAWETVLDKIVNSLTGPVAYSIAIISIVVCGMTMAFADLQCGAKKLMQACCGLAITFFSSQIVVNFLGFQGAIIS